MDSRNATIYHDTYDEEEEVQSELMPYYEDDEDDGGYIEVNDDSYWDVYFEPDILNTSFSD
jgi:hypothetical protein